MKRIAANDPITKSPDLSAENLAKLRALFPELITEGKDGVAVNVDVLKSLVGDKTVTDTEEKYGLNWHGKRLARQLALTPSTGTLRPCPDESVDWDNTKNLMIEGDNLEVLKLLQKSYSGKVKLIYIDPPYNTGKDFVYPDNFQDNIKNYLELTGQVEGGRKISSNTEASGRFHTDWLNMMYPRLKLARNLLREDGVIFISIDDHEVVRLRNLCDDIFGEENFIAAVIWQKKYSTKADSKDFSESHEYLVCYRKSDVASISGLQRSEDQEHTYKNPDNDPRGDWASDNLLRTEERDYAIYPITSPNGQEHMPPKGSSWRYNKEKMAVLLTEKRIWFGETGNSKPRLKRFRTDVRETIPPQTIWKFEDVGHTDEGTKELAKLFENTGSPFPNPKPVRLLQQTVNVGSDKGAIVLDFFAGSGTSGHAVWMQNIQDEGDRRWIVVQLPEPVDPLNKEDRAMVECCDRLGKKRFISELTKERLRRAGKKIREEWQAKQTPSESPKSKKSAVKGPDLFSDPDLAVAAQTPAPTTPPDLGFRVFKLDSTNIMEWDPKHADLKEAMQMSIEHLKDDRSNDDILYELLLKLGIDLCTPIETKTITKHQVHSIGVGSMLVCLSPSITQDDLETLAMGIIEWWNQLAPTDEEKKDRKTSVVFRDSAFKDDIIKTNLSAILHQNGLTTIRSL